MTSQSAPRIRKQTRGSVAPEMRYQFDVFLPIGTMYEWERWGVLFEIA